MKILALVSICSTAFLLASCGGGESTESTGSTVAVKADATKTIVDSAKPPHVRLPPGPPPKKLIVKDIRLGSGAAIPRRGNVEINTNFVAVGYRTGKPSEVRWAPKGSFKIEFGPGLEVKGWEKGLVGMRVGGRRKLLVPSKLAYEAGALMYVVDLLAVRR